MIWEKVWWYNKCTVGIWVWIVCFGFFVDMAKTLARGESLTISWKTWKCEQKYYISKKNEEINEFIVLCILEFLFGPDSLKAIKILAQNIWDVFRCKIDILISRKTPKINSYKTVSQFTK